MRRSLSLDELEQGFRKHERRFLARAITLVESKRSDHRRLGQQLLQRLLPRTGMAVRLGVTGVPGVGKSTFIESFGLYLIEQCGLSVAVLAIDPSSSLRGGSILGDKTRMQRLSNHPKAYVRPSPSQGSLGGVHRKTRESMLLCEAFGFEVILVETVGVGQSETAVSQMVDTFLVLMLAGAGDELQGIKKGILEVADVLAVNKADGDNRLAAERAQSSYQRALHFVAPKRECWPTPVLTVSGKEALGLEDLWRTLQDHRVALRVAGEFEAMRRQQQRGWMWSLVEDELMARFREHPEVKSHCAELEQAVLDGELTPGLAADRLLGYFFS